MLKPNDSSVVGKDLDGVRFPGTARRGATPLRSFSTRQKQMNQNNPETYALTARCPIEDAARLRTAARLQGKTLSALVAELIHQAAQNACVSQRDLAWADERRTKNARRRSLQDERTRRGDFRKPGWEFMPAYRHSLPK